MGQENQADLSLKKRSRRQDKGIQNQGKYPVTTLLWEMLSSPGPRSFALAIPFSLVLSEDKIQFLGADGGGRVLPGLPTSTELTI